MGNKNSTQYSEEQLVSHLQQQYPHLSPPQIYQLYQKLVIKYQQQQLLKITKKIATMNMKMKMIVK